MYQPPFMPQYSGMPNKYEIIHVNGENGARSLNMAPNSNALLLDDTAPIVWLVQTDGAGYKTASPFKIEPYTPEPAPDMNELLKRIEALEKKANEKPDMQPSKRAKEPAAE